MEDRKEDLLKKDTKEEEPTKGEKLEDDQSRKYFHSSGSSEIYASQPHSRSAKKIPIFLGIAIIILVLGASLYFLRARPENQSEATPSPTFESTPNQELTLSPQPATSFERSKLSLRVLNGTKLNGLAASTSAKLKDLGYKIERTGNATNSAFLKTIVRVKPDLDKLLENLLQDLSALDFEGEEGPQLNKDDTSDGEIILGAK